MCVCALSYLSMLPAVFDYPSSQVREGHVCVLDMGTPVLVGVGVGVSVSGGGGVGVDVWV